MGNTTTFISRLLEGIKNGTDLKPTVTPESLSSYILGKDTDIASNEDDSINGISNSNLEYPVIPSIDEFRTTSHSSKLEEKPSSSADDYRFGMDKKARTEFNKENSEELKKKRLISRIENANGKFVTTNYKTKSDELSVRPEGAISDIPGQRNLPYDNTSSKNDHLSRALIDRLQRNEISKSTTETTVTINIGKITVRAVNDSNSYRITGHESKQSKKLSLNDYLRKRSEKGS